MYLSAQKNIPVSLLCNTALGLVSCAHCITGGRQHESDGEPPERGNRNNRLDIRLKLKKLVVEDKLELT
jgi:hypothetical protein